MQSELSTKLPKPKKEKIRGRIRQRLRWLELQYPTFPEKLSKVSIRYWAKKIPYIRNKLSRRRFDVDLYEPQPYSQAAGVFRKEGATEHARSIDYVQRKLTGKKRIRHASWKRPFFWVSNCFFDLSSGFGLSPIRTLLVTLLFIVIGGMMTTIANHKGLLIVDALPVVQAAKEVNGVVEELAYSTQSSGRRAGDLLCGHSIEPILYATDIFIPLLDLRQEIRCMIRPANSPIKQPMHAAIDANDRWNAFAKSLASVMTNNVNTWHWMRSIYSIIGWIMVSLLIYTLSHSLRAKDSRP